MKTKLILILLIAAIGKSTASYAQNSDDELREAITEMINFTGSDAMFENTFDQVIKQFQAAFPGQIPDEFWSDFKSEMNYGELRNQLIDVYMKYYTVEDVKAIMAFYRSDVGQKLLKLNPTITAESMKIGMDWGKKMSERVLNRLQNDGIIKM